MPEKNVLFDPPPVDFVFRRFPAYMGPWMAFRANPGTTRPPALALASTSSRAERVGQKKNPAVRRTKMHAVVVLYVVVVSCTNV